MRIAIDLLLAEKEPGGMLYAAHALLERLARIDHTNEYFIITSRPQDYHHLTTARMHLQPIKWHFDHALLIQHQICASNILRKLRPDLLHVPAFAAPLDWNGPLVVTAHDLAFLKIPQQASHYARNYWQCMLRESVLRADAIIAVSARTRDELVACWSVDPARIYLIHNALRDSLCVSTSQSVGPQPLRLPADSCTLHVGQRNRKGCGPTERHKDKLTAQQSYAGRYLLHVGRIMPRKNIRVLIEAFEILAPRFADLQLVLTGGVGYGSEDVVRYIESSFYAPRIHQVGWVSDMTLKQLYQGASMLVFPSRYEGFGLPALEAMRCGTPVVASLEAASPEIVGEAVMHTNCSEAGPLASAIEQLLINDTLRQRLNYLGRIQTNVFTSTACAEKTLDVYQQVADKRAIPSEKPGNSTGTNHEK
jgi:glycosyltransferase involved in cell wall biosynthesis